MINKGIGIYVVSMMSILGMEKEERRMEDFNETCATIIRTVETHIRTIRTIIVLQDRTPYSRASQYHHKPRKLTQQNNESLENMDPFLEPPKILPGPQPHLLDPLNLVDYKDETEKGK